MLVHVLLLNLVFFIPATCGATALVLVWRRILRTAPPSPPAGPGGGSNVRLPSAGPNDLARSA
ncbi:MAG TPA: hypothetical protein VFA37_07365 [Gaiellaceae bacterium]|nr:hypothetical protein [Gaiellaceae bacterium]